MLQPRIPFASAVLALSAFGSAHAADQYPWRNHEPPLNFIFGNEIDTHQQTRLMRDGSLFGFFYIRFTGVQTKDRYPVATHVDCNANPDCTVGWSLNGNPISASFFTTPWTTTRCFWPSAATSRNREAPHTSTGSAR